MKKIVLILLAIGWSLVYGQQPVELLQQKLNALTSLKADFSQTVKAKGKVIQRSKGTMALKRPGKFRWYTQSPMKQLIVADGNKLWIFDQELEQVTVKSQKKGLGGTPALFLSGYDETLGRQFEVKVKQNSKEQVFQLRPKTEESSFQRVVLIYRGKTLTAIELQDKLDQTTFVRFSRIRINPPLKSSLFRFKPPKGVDVIKA